MRARHAVGPHSLQRHTALLDSCRLRLDAQAAGVCGERSRCDVAGCFEKLGRARSASCAGVGCFMGE